MVRYDLFLSVFQTITDIATLDGTGGVFVYKLACVAHTLLHRLLNWQLNLCTGTYNAGIATGEKRLSHKILLIPLSIALSLLLLLWLFQLFACLLFSLFCTDLDFVEICFIEFFFCKTAQ